MQHLRLGLVMGVGFMVYRWLEEPGAGLGRGMLDRSLPE